MHLLYQINDKVGLVRYEDAWVFTAKEIKIPVDGDYLITACGINWNKNGGARIQLKVNGEIVAHKNSEIVSYAGSFRAGDKIYLDAFNMVNTLLMLYEIK